MVVRLKTNWNLDKGARTHSETASVISTNIWRIITEALLNMENQGFATESNSQRLDILSEFAAYAIHLLDRYLYSSSRASERQKMVSQTAQHLGGIIHDNRLDTKAVTNANVPFMTLLNDRTDKYSECKYDDEPGFDMRRVLGDYVSEIMRGENRKWTATYILDIVAYNIHSNLLKVLSNFLSDSTS